MTRIRIAGTTTIMSLGAVPASVWRFIKSGLSLVLPDGANITTADKPIERTAEGFLRYRLYGQDGTFIHMTCQDTPDMERFVRWTRRFDRYTIGSDRLEVVQ